MVSEIKQYREYLRLRNKSENTIDIYVGKIRKFLEYEDLPQFLLSIIDRADNTRNGYIVAVKHWLKFKKILHEYDPELLETVTVRDSIPSPVIPSAEITLILRGLKPHHRAGKASLSKWRTFLMVELLALCGLRPAELVQIILEDINPNTETIFVHSVKREKPRLAYPPKVFFAHLQRYMELADFESPKDRLFDISAQQVTNVVKDATGHRPKDFRTTFATAVWRKKKDIKLLQKLMGHLFVASSEPYIILGEEYAQQIKEVELYD